MTKNKSDNLNKGVTLIIAAVAAFIGSYMTSAVNVALPTIGKEMEAKAVLLSWVINTVMMAQTIVLIPTGRFADIYGRKKMFIAGSLLFTISSFLCAYAGSVVQLIIYRIIQGMGAGIVIVCVIAILPSVFPAGERGKALGSNVGATYAGLSAGPLIGGFMTQHFGWRSIFIFSGILSLLVTIVSFRSLQGEWADAKGDKFDFTGTGVFIAALAMIIYGFCELLSVEGPIILVLGIAGIAVFTWLETRTDCPILDVTQFKKNTIFVFSNVAALISYCAAFAISFLLSLYLQYTQGLSPQSAGLVIVVQSVVMTCVSPIAGRFSDRFDPLKVALIGMCFLLISILLFIFFSERTPIGFIICTLVISGLGYGLFSSGNTIAIMSSVDTKLLGVASGTMGTMRNFGMTLSMGIVMIIFTIFIGDTQITEKYFPAFLTSFRMMFIISSALCFFGILTQIATLGTRKGSNR